MSNSQCQRNTMEARANFEFRIFGRHRKVSEGIGRLGKISNGEFQVSNAMV
ncbi:hypothetical protein Cflav_PD0254 [Pedosphaera parvula Ellin514]|uniref:Uncharacterized protein n=1 Tax=Pedosphaera parvula (strain Ellin514) TaxID=320771 RepID=B9XRV0_PEDPL|nr:hypothetical protein Cflav_PD0254 [Pedosphaera parvula Ellin514]